MAENVRERNFIPRIYSPVSPASENRSGLYLFSDVTEVGGDILLEKTWFLIFFIANFYDN